MASLSLNGWEFEIPNRPTSTVPPRRYNLQPDFVSFLQQFIQDSSHTAKPAVLRIKKSTAASGSKTKNRSLIIPSSQNVPRPAVLAAVVSAFSITRFAPGLQITGVERLKPTVQESLKWVCFVFTNARVCWSTGVRKSAIRSSVSSRVITGFLPRLWTMPRWIRFSSWPRSFSLLSSVCSEFNRRSFVQKTQLSGLRLDPFFWIWYGTGQPHLKSVDLWLSLA